MRRTQWRGTILFVVILTAMGATAGLKLYGLGNDAAALPAATGSATAPPTPASTATPSPAPSTSTAAAAPAPAPAAAPKTVDGSVVNTRYGPVQVQLTFLGTQITAVKTLQSPSGDGRSVSINQQATPILAQEVLSSQSAQVNTVSGASYTSAGYIQSAQYAIDHK